MSQVVVSPLIEEILSNHFVSCAQKAPVRNPWELRRLISKASPPAPTTSNVEETRAIGPELDKSDPTAVSSVARTLRNTIARTTIGLNIRFTAKEMDCLCAADPEIVIVLTTAASGYVRQAALSRVSRSCSPIGLALVLLRLNDWVFQVRNEAVATLKRLMEGDRSQNSGLATQISANLGLLLDDNRFERTQTYDEDYAMVKELVAYPGVYEQALQLIMNRPGRVANRVLTMGLRNGYFDDALFRIATGAKDALRRRKAVLALLRGKYAWNAAGRLQQRTIEASQTRSAVLEHAKQDTSAPVVAAALDHVISTGTLDQMERENLLNLLLRRETSLAQRAHYIIEASGSSSAELLRQVQRNDKNTVAICRALGRFGSASDADTVYRIATGKDGKDRFICHEAAAKLGHPQARRELSDTALSTADHALANKALHALLGLGLHVSYAELRAYMDQENCRVTPALLRHVAKCKAIEIATLIVLVAQRGGTEENLDILWRALVRKRMHGSFEPSEKQVQDFFEMASANPQLRDKLARELMLINPV